MTLAAFRNDFGYDFVLLLHILTVIIGLAPTWALAALAMKSSGDTDGSRERMYGRIAELNQRVFATSLIIAGLLGFALAGMAESEIISMGDAWISISILLWIAMVGLMHGGIVPAQRAIAAGDTGADDKLKMFGAIFHVVALVMLVLMVFKPGSNI